jgi:hypothetical protein
MAPARVVRRWFDLPRRVSPSQFEASRFLFFTPLLFGLRALLVLVRLDQLLPARVASRILELRRPLLFELCRGDERDPVEMAGGQGIPCDLGDVATPRVGAAFDQSCAER